MCNNYGAPVLSGPKTSIIICWNQSGAPVDGHRISGTGI